MQVAYPNISKIIGYNPHNPAEPFWMQQGFNFIVYVDKEKKVFHVPIGFQSDGCTIKSKLLQLFLGCPHEPKYLIGSIIHDYFCKNRYLIDRQTASDTFEYILLKEGANPEKVKKMKFWMNLYQKYCRRWE